MSAWIRMIADAEATGSVKEMFDLARTPHGTIDNVLRVHGLRPHTIQGHISLYKSVLHHPDNTLPPWFLETVGTYTSMLNQCEYSVTHHSLNLKRLVNDEDRANRILSSLRNRNLETSFVGKELAMLRYTEKLTLDVGGMDKSDYRALVQSGCNDGEILELNQVIGYFCYVNRLLNGLGVTTDGDRIGYY